MKIFGIEYKTRRELIEENEKLKAENKAVIINKTKYVAKYEKYHVHRCRSEFIVPYGDESHFSYQKIKEYLCEQLTQEIFRNSIFEKRIDSLGRRVFSAEIPVLRKEQNI